MLGHGMQKPKKTTMEPDTTESKGWLLFLDDLREPGYVYRDLLPDSERHPKNWVVAKSSAEAKELVESKGMPSMMSLDHDLGGEDTSFVFLSWLAREYWDGVSPVPKYRVHSQNPTGSLNLKAFMDSWAKSVDL